MQQNEVEESFATPYGPVLFLVVCVNCEICGSYLRDF